MSSYGLDQFRIEERLKRAQEAREAAQRIVCPECGSVVYDLNGGWYEDPPVSLWGDDTHDVWCSECDHSFQVKERVERTFEVVT